MISSLELEEMDFIHLRLERIQLPVTITDRQIDQLVYQLYGLTDEEIRIVEGTS
jgi:hypothetical protein